MRPIRTAIGGALVAWCALVPAARAEPYAVGATMAPVTLEDQHGRPAALTAETRVLVLSRDMQGGDVVKQALADVDQAWLEARGALYVADISGMPALVSRMIAVPRMRARGYRVLLDRDGVATRAVPYEKGAPTVLRLDRLQVVRVLHPKTAGELTAAVEAAAPPP